MTIQLATEATPDELMESASDRKVPRLNVATPWPFMSEGHIKEGVLIVNSPNVITGKSHLRLVSEERRSQKED